MFWTPARSIPENAITQTAGLRPYPGSARKLLLGRRHGKWVFEDNSAVLKIEVASKPG